jgi:nicotinamide-nucleotide amidase
MNAVILSIGDELTNGQTVDTNSAYLSRELARRGIATLAHCTVGDDRRLIAGAIRQACGLSELVLVTGGLGPTEDDLTRQALADVLGVELRLHPKCLAVLEEFFRRRGRTMVDANRIQAMVPLGAEVLENQVGTAAGLAAKVGSSQVYIVPGVPFEMRWIFENVIAARLPAQEGVIVHRVIHTFGAGESDVGAKIADLMQRGANPTVGTTVAAGLVSIRVVTGAQDAAASRAMSQPVVDDIKRRLGTLVVGEDEQTMASALGELLHRAGQTVASAESCTGGMIGQMLTSVPGSSNYYLGGVIAYDNRIKQELLGVPQELLDQHGAVSEPVALAMAAGCLKRFNSDWAISITGIAGPGGGTDEKPVGLVYVALAGKTVTPIAARTLFPGQRDMIRLRSSLAAMDMLRTRLIRAGEP